ncbi:DUF2786 domain-containing protein [Paenibacillus illinoisensis]|uniref:DUF2786 domain-containing protein n=1 Tax=Paenibacillus illinoisensis TaxID=59845 RepID=UPI003019E311
MNRERAIEIVRKCIALSGNNPSIEEAKTAILMAQRLMAEHNISDNDIGVSNEQKELAHNVVVDWGRNPLWKRILASIIAENFRCFWYVRSDNGKTQIIIMGLVADAEIARELYSFAIQCLTKELAKHKYNSSLKNDFIYGFIDGIRLKLSQQTDSNANALSLGLPVEVRKEVDRLGFVYTTSRGVSSNDDKTAYNIGLQQVENYF